MVKDKVQYILRLTANLLMALEPAGRTLSIFDDDIFIVSYPKSGNTWVRFMLGNLYYKDQAVTFANIESKVPDIYRNSSKTLSRFNRPRLLKSHEYLDPRYSRVIYIVRDPRDVAISYYNYMLKMCVIDEGYSILEFVKRFVGGKLDPFGAWGDHVGGWIGARSGKEGFLFLHCEDMLENPVREIKKMAETLNLSASEDKIKNAVEMSSFKRMQKLENQEGGSWSSIKSGRKDIPFVRKGKKEGWREELPLNAIEIIENAWSDLMTELGYRVSNNN